MPKPRTPAAVLKAGGTFDKDPGRSREDFEAGAFDPTPPTYFKVNQKAVWNEIVGVLPATVLQATDRMVVDLAARLIAQFRNQPDTELTPAQPVGGRHSRFTSTWMRSTRSARSCR